MGAGNKQRKGKVKKMEEIKKILGKEEYEFYGIRMDDAEYNIGDTCQISHQWWQDDPEDGSEYVADMSAWDGGKLSGTCSFEVTIDTLEDIIDLAKSAFGYYNKMYLIGGDVAEGGNDAGEIIIADAKILYGA